MGKKHSVGARLSEGNLRLRHKLKNDELNASGYRPRPIPPPGDEGAPLEFVRGPKVPRMSYIASFRILSIDCGS